MKKHTLFFLSSDVPLTKSFWLNTDGEVQKTSYPNVRNFTSHEEQCTNIVDFHKHLVAHAAEGHCLIKGALHKTLNDEPRAGSTKSEDSTWWVCFDLDGAPYPSVKDFIKAVPALKDVQHVVQYSASYAVDGSTKLSAHVFMMLDAMIPAATLKVWLMDLNLNTPDMRLGVVLSRTGAALHWPVDITACQNDKLIYIAPPSIAKGVSCNLKNSERIQLIPGKHLTLSAKSLVPRKKTEEIKTNARDLRNSLRKEAGYEPIRTQIKWVGDTEVQPKPGQAMVTGVRQERGFTYLNLNGGDSWGYYHPDNDYELIRNFKGEPAYYTKELLPDYYKDLRVGTQAKQGQATQAGDIILAFCDKRTGNYIKGSWNPETFNLELHPAKSELQLAHWMQNNGLPPYDVIPVWDVHFDPQSSVIMDEERMRINTYVPTPWFRQEHDTRASMDKCPLIKRIILHAVSGGKEDETYEHFLNWLAVVFQHRVKPKTAWIWHGVEGTGKGVLIARVISPLLGRAYVMQKRASELEEKFNSWLEQALIAFIDEIEVSASQKKDTISGDLRNFITEDCITVRGMNKAAILVDNFTGFIFSSNKNEPVMIPAADRRYNVGYFQTKRIEITQQELDEQLPAELSAFMSYIMTRKASVATAASSLKNEAHALMVATSRTSLDELAHQIANGDLVALWDSVVDLNIAAALNQTNSGYAVMYREILQREIRLLQSEIDNKAKIALKNKAPYPVTAKSKLSRDELTVIFEHCVGNMPKTPNKFTSLLRHRNIHTERIRINDKVTYGLKVEWRAPVSWLVEMCMQFDAEDKPKLKRIK